MYTTMIVDDEYDIREGLAKLINWNEQGFAVTSVAGDGIEALEVYMEERPSLVITDIKMPGMDGLELAGKLRSICSDVEIIILSGYNDFEYARQALKHKVSGYILKPVLVDELCSELEEVRLHLSEKSGFQPSPKEMHHSVRTDKQSVLVTGILDYIIANLHEDINLKKLSSLFYVNAIYLGQLFRKETGMYFHSYMNRLRIEKAKALLVENRFSINAVSEMVGYKNLEHFYLSFKNIEGCSPGEYIRNYSI